MWLEGQAEAQDKMMQMMAWVQANLINIQIPKGKPRVTIEKLMPKRARKKVEQSEEEISALVGLLEATPLERNKAKAKRVRERAEREEAAQFFASPEGRRLKQLADEFCGEE